MPPVGLDSSRAADLWRPLSRDYESKVLSITSFAMHRARMLQPLRPGIVIDAGCGPLGLLLRDVATIPHTIPIGMDFCDEMVVESRSRTAGCDVRYVLGDLRAMPFASQSIDTILAINSFVPEERADVDAIFHEAHRMLQKGGRLVAVLPSFEMSFVARDRWQMPLRLDLEQHREWDTSGWQCFYTTEDIDHLMKRHRFSVYWVERLTLSTQREIDHIKRVYASSLANVPEQRLYVEPLFEHVLVAER